MRKCHMIQSKYWSKARDKSLTSNEILVEIFLITCPNCGPSGGFMIAPATIGYHIGISEGTVYDALKVLELKDRIKLYPGDWTWVIGKWEYEGTDSPKLLEALKTDLACFPDALKRDFSIRYPDAYKKAGIGYPENEIPEGKHEERKGLGKHEEKEPPQRFEDAVIQIFPDVIKSQIAGQAKVLEEIERIDGKKLDELIPSLVWAKDDNQPSGDWQGWSKNFLSCAGLRKRRDGAGGAMKWQKIEAAYNAVQNKYRNRYG